MSTKTASVKGNVKANKVEETVSIAPVVQQPIVAPVVQPIVAPVVETPVAQPVVIAPAVQPTYEVKSVTITQAATQAMLPRTNGGFHVEMVEDVPTQRGRAKGSGRINEIVTAIKSYKENPALHGKWIRIATFESAQAANTVRKQLVKEHAELCAQMDIVGGSYTDATIKDGSKLLIKYGIPVA